MIIEIKNGRYTNNKTVCGFLVLFWIVFISVLSFNALEISTKQWFRSILFFPLGLFFPGYLLSRTVTSKNNSSELFAFSMFFGIGFCVLEYFLDSYIQMPIYNGRAFSMFLGPILSIPSFFVLRNDIKKQNRSLQSLLPDFRIILLIIVIEVTAFASTALASGIPVDKTGKTAAYVDVVWNIGNIASLGHGWPAQNFQYFGKSLNSNIIGLILRVVEGRFIGSTAAETMLVFSSLYCFPVLVFSLDAFGLVISNGNKKVSFLYVFVFLFVGYLSRAFLFLYNTDWAYSVSYTSYIIDDVRWLINAPYGLDIAFPGCALLLTLISKYLTSKIMTKELAISLVITAFLLTGGKYVFCVCILGAFFGTMIVQLIQKKKPGKIIRTLIPPFLFIVMGFSIAYFGIVSGGEIHRKPTECEPSFLDRSDSRYSAAREQYVLNLANKNYSFIVVKSRDLGAEPVVRQGYNGRYYICGSDLQFSVIEENEMLNILNNSYLQTEGLLAGLGGYYETSDKYNSGIVISNALGFIRYIGEEDEHSSCCFVSFLPSVDMIETDPRSTWDTYAEMFIPGGDGTDMKYTEPYSSFSINAAMERTRLYKNLIADTGIKESPMYFLFMLLTIPLYLLVARPVTAIPFVLWTKQKMGSFYNIGAYDSILCGTAICGLLAFFILSVNGLSQGYFLDTAVIIIDAIGVLWLWNNRQRFSKMTKLIIYLAATIGICTHIAFFSYAARQGIYNLDESKEEYQKTVLPGENYITCVEWEAMEWLRYHTTSDAVIATNRHYNTTNVSRSQQPRPNDMGSRYYYYSAYSERQMFLGSWAYMARTPEMQKMLRERLVANDALFNPLCANKREIMESNGIDYLLASAEVGTGMNLIDEDLICVFYNDDIAIYRLAEEEADGKM